MDDIVYILEWDEYDLQRVAEIIHKHNPRCNSVEAEKMNIKNTALDIWGGDMYKRATYLGTGGWYVAFVQKNYGDRAWMAKPFLQTFMVGKLLGMEETV